MICGVRNCVNCVFGIDLLEFVCYGEDFGFFYVVFGNWVYCVKVFDFEFIWIDEYDFFGVKFY